MWRGHSSVWGSPKRKPFLTAMLKMQGTIFSKLMWAEHTSSFSKWTMGTTTTGYFKVKKESGYFNSTISYHWEKKVCVNFPQIRFWEWICGAWDAIPVSLRQMSFPFLHALPSYACTPTVFLKEYIYFLQLTTEMPVLKRIHKAEISSLTE